MKKIENLKNLLSQLLEKAKQEDLVHKKKSLNQNKAHQAMGESFWVFHLKEAIKLTDEIEK